MAYRQGKRWKGSVMYQYKRYTTTFNTKEAALEWETKKRRELETNNTGWIQEWHKKIDHDVYFMFFGCHDGLYVKVGMTCDLSGRQKCIQYRPPSVHLIDNHEKTLTIACFNRVSAAAFEYAAKRILQNYHYHGEWFFSKDGNQNELRQAIDIFIGVTRAIVVGFRVMSTPPA